MQLLDANRSARRTILDALEVLRSKPGFSDDARAVIRTRMLRLPNGDTPSLIQVVCEEIGWVVSLPMASGFEGMRTGGPRPEQFKIGRLDGADVDADGNVELSDGTHLHRVHVVSTPIDPKLSERDALIVHMVVACMGAQAECYQRYYFPVMVRKKKTAASKNHSLRFRGSARIATPAP